MIILIFDIFLISKMFSKTFTNEDLKEIRSKASFDVVDSIDELIFKTSEQYEKSIRNRS